jgi:hypothetical protein
MTSKLPPTVNPSSFLLPATTIAIAIAIFVVDTIASLEIAVSPFYAAVVLLAVRFLDGRNVLLVAIGCVVLSLLSFWLTQEDEPSAIALANLVVGILVIALTTYLALQNQSAQIALREKAGLLDLTHDTMFVRDMNDVVSSGIERQRSSTGGRRRRQSAKSLTNWSRQFFPPRWKRSRKTCPALDVGRETWFTLLVMGGK